MQMERRGEIDGGKSEEVISALLNARPEYMNMGSSGNRGEKIEYMVAVRYRVQDRQTCVSFQELKALEIFIKQYVSNTSRSMVQSK